MRFNRTFHPVGHGAFFTEQIYDDNNKVLFTAVYDCGSSNQSDLQKPLNDFIKTCNHIDLLCISHFDNDHISGINLLSKQLLNKNTIVLIPFKFPKALIVLNHPITAIITMLLNINVRIIGVDADDESEPSREMDYEELRDGRIIKEGTAIQINRLHYKWIYVPLMHKTLYRNILNDFKTALTNSSLDYNRLGDINYVNSNIQTIKQIYQGLKSVGSQGKVSSINMNSLMLLSFTTVSIHNNIIDHFYNNCSFHYRCHRMCWLEWDKYDEFAPSSCLYTGDTNLSNQSAFESLMRRATKYCREPIGILQIPHHGSCNNYGSFIADSTYYKIAFVNYKTTRKDLHHQIAFDFIMKQRLLCPVTQESITVFNQIIVF